MRLTICEDIHALPASADYKFAVTAPQPIALALARKVCVVRPLISSATKSASWFAYTDSGAKGHPGFWDAEYVWCQIFIAPMLRSGLHAHYLASDTGQNAQKIPAQTERKMLLLNDTDEDGTHFGCMRVMRTIRSSLAERGAKNLPSLKVGTNWRDNPEAMRLIDAASVVVINGEGTLHHGKRKGRWLLDAGARVKDRGGRVALINALWQENPPEWAAIAGRFDFLSCRDSQSAAALATQSGRPVSWCGDLSTYTPWHFQAAAPRLGISVSCSVHREVTEKLAQLAARLGGDYMPLTSQIKTVSPQLTGLKRLWRQIYAKNYTRSFLKKFPETKLVNSDLDYMAEISKHELLVTGRFHAVCLAIVTGTPFVAVSSNSWKIEALLKDIGIDSSRVIPLESLSPEVIKKRDWSFSVEEQRAMANRLVEWRLAGSALFDRVAALR